MKVSLLSSSEETKSIILIDASHAGLWEKRVTAREIVNHALSSVEIVKTIRFPTRLVASVHQVEGSAVLNRFLPPRLPLTRIPMSR
jgi:hypothetical protein